MGNMGGIGINIALNVMSQLEIGVMMCGVFCVPITKKKPSLAVGLLLFIVFCAGGDWKAYDYAFFSTFGIFLPIVTWMSVTEGEWFRRLAVYICSVMYLGLPYFCFNFLFSSISGSPAAMWENDGIYRLARGICTIVAVGILANVLRRKIGGYRQIVNSLPTGYFIVGSVCAFAGSMVHHFVAEISRGYESVRWANIVSACAIIVSMMFYALSVISAVLDIFRKRYKEESSLKEQYLQIAKNYVKTVRDNAKETRKIRHDIQNHMNILSYHMENSDYQKAQTYLSEMRSHMDESVRKTVSVNHEIVDAILLQMQSEAQGEKIQWEVEGFLPAELSIGDFDLCTIFSNLLSNSIEACRKVEEGKRYIHLEIRRLEDKLVIEVENPSEQGVDVERLGAVTSKKDSKNHGYGILNIKDAVHKNYGDVWFESAEGRFTARIVFPLPFQ